jgi:hypothetical protein
MRLGFLIVLFVSLSAQAQDSAKTLPIITEYTPPKYKIKVNLFDQSVFSLPCIKVHNEIFLGGESSGNFNYLSADLGYNYYSNDEQVGVNGIYTGLRINHYLPSYGAGQKAVSFGVFYQYTAINDYLKTDRFYPGLGTFSEYEKMRYNKQRYGANVEVLKQYNIYGPVFFEWSLAIGFIFMETHTPERSTQTTFVNGVTYKKNNELPSLGFGMKLGYSLF